jgi:penicillin-binding protein 1A
VLSPAVAETARGILASVVQSGTGVRASLGGTTFAAGKTGTTEESGDAWFVGFTDRLTVAVWVGYPEGFKPMRTEFNGGPVEGGTFPALIWRAFMMQAESLLGAREDERRARKGLPPESETTTPSTTTPAPSTPAAPAVPDADGTDGGEEPAPATQEPAEPATPAPTPATPAPDEPAPAPAPSTPATPAPGGGGTGGTGAAAPPG